MEKFQQIKRCIEWIAGSPQESEPISFVANKMGLSVAELNQEFIDWGNVTVKKFFNSLREKQLVRLLAPPSHDLFSPQNDNPVEELPSIIFHSTPLRTSEITVYYSFFTTRFGEVCMARSPKGICSLSFIETKETALENLAHLFPSIKKDEDAEEMKNKVLPLFDKNRQNRLKIPLDLCGTAFQLKVWKAVLQIPMGKLSTYGEIAQNLHQQNASRAVGTAIGKNPIAFLIPCHRVIQKSGKLGGYRWGIERKKIMLGWELAQMIG